MTISTPSSSASSSSQGDALKKPRGRRAITLMSLPPSRREERQQSIAVLPTPMIRTRSPIESDVAESDRAQPVDADMNAIRIVAPRKIEILAARRAAADEHRIEALVQQRPQTLDGRVVTDLHAHVEDGVDLVRQAPVPGSRNDGMLVRIRPPGLSYFSKIVTE